jgi:GTP cyclohydrolase II
VTLFPYTTLFRSIHSQCVTGEVFHSLRCDCRDQLQLALQTIAQRGAGLVIYDQQEGRGIGLIEKLRAYELQDQGLDTVDANLRLGHAIDLRNYQLPVRVLRFLKIRSLRLMSNNPDKIKAVLSAGIQVVERIAADTQINPHSEQYVATKKNKLGHLTDPAFTANFAGADVASDRLIRETCGGRTSSAIPSLAFAALGLSKQ